MPFVSVSVSLRLSLYKILVSVKALGIKSHLLTALVILVCFSFCNLVI